MRVPDRIHDSAPAAPTCVGGQPKNFLQACLLLFLHEGPAHGYALKERLWDLGPTQDAATVYRTLRCLERDALVESVWLEPEDGHARRHYEITSRGRAMLTSWATTLTESRNTLDVYLARYAATTGHDPAEGASAH